MSRTPTNEELRNIKNLVAEAQYRATLEQALFTRLQKKYDVATADGVAFATGAFVSNGQMMAVCVSAEETKALALARRDKQDAEQQATLASFELRKICEVELSAQWDPKAKMWIFPEEQEQEQVSLPPETAAMEACEAPAAGEAMVTH